MFMVTDNLTITPSSSSSAFSVLSNLSIPLYEVRELELVVGVEEFILKAMRKKQQTNPKDVKFSLKAMINKQKTKVLYVEADNDFFDVLLSFLALPLGTIVRVLKNHYGDEVPFMGSLTTLYNGLYNLDSGLFRTPDCKNLLLNPISSSQALPECRRLKIKVDETKRTKYFKCGDVNCSFSKFSNVGLYFSGLKCDCGKPLDKAIYRRGVYYDEDGVYYDEDGVFITSKVSLIISDDLQVLPKGTGSTAQILRKFGIIDTVGIEERNLTFGLNEIMDLLKGSLLCQAPLTELILGIKPNDYTEVNCEIGGILPIDEIKYLIQTFNFKKLTLKAILQRSSNKLLFAEVGDDFVDFLFTMLAVPLGGVELLMGGDTFLKNIDNFYKSVGDLNGDDYFKNKRKIRTHLLEPKLPFCYISKRHFPSPSHKDFPSLYFYQYVGGGYLSHSRYVGSSVGIKVTRYKFPEGQASCLNLSDFKFLEGPGNYGKYVEGPMMFTVTDDLTVKPSSSALGISILNSLKIPSSDVKELKLVVGLEEVTFDVEYALFRSLSWFILSFILCLVQAMSILKASLTSSRALTDGLRAEDIYDQNLGSCVFTTSPSFSNCKVLGYIMSEPKDFRFTLKAMINKQKTKVLYVEADNHFVDVLLSFLTLPLGTIVQLLKKHYGDEVPVLGSLTTLYNGLHNLDSGLFPSPGNKNLLLNPTNPSPENCCRLKINIYGTQPTNDTRGVDAKYGLFIKSKSTLIITDDLQVLPGVMGSAVHIFRNSGITDTKGIEERNLTFGFDEIMDLLRGLLFSRSPLTELVLGKKAIHNIPVKCEGGGIRPANNQIKQQTEICNVEKMRVKAILQESTNKLLFVEADDDFVDFLFNLLALPLGGVEWLLGSDTLLKNIDNFYKTVENIQRDKLFNMTDELLGPNFKYSYGSVVSISKFPKWRSQYFYGQIMYMVMDDLTVTPLCTCSGISILKSLKIPFSDVKELKLLVGLEEAKSILKASLTSACALTDGLINPVLMKQPKQES
ncbi:hypothetical protein STAS_30746 [Striga asiatica]|uniref:DUF674 family protein n=1 Tax=Striga asiatica TaxID=4170 RepID=A0A5A7R6C5_STRAF|nr:hypothetical protein STAS_30746 [Striga asiatica]